MLLEKSTNNKLITTYPKEVENDAFFKVFGSIVKNPIKYTYFELYNKSGELVGIIKDRAIATFAAEKNKLDYREVEFTEEFVIAED